MSKLREQYNKAVNAYVQAFCKKQDVPFDGWVADNDGGVADFGGFYYFDIADIIYDIDTEQPKGSIFEWQDKSLEFNIDLPHEKRWYMNYESWCKGLRFGEKR